MKPTPKGWPRIAASVFYEDPAAAIDWLCKAFGFRIRIKVEGEGGRIEHSELEYGDDGLLMVGGLHRAPHRRSPRSIDGCNTQSLMLYIDDAVAHCEHARASGAKILQEPRVTDHGEDYWADKSYEVEDPEGHRWWFCERVRG
jgi:uncharacterized glyoxalase superfamily protein PhnB